MLAAMEFFGKLGSQRTCHNTLVFLAADIFSGAAKSYANATNVNAGLRASGASKVGYKPIKV